MKKIKQLALWILINKEGIADITLELLKNPAIDEFIMAALKFFILKKSADNRKN
ncbi:hypothetical protein [Paenibacillus chitinolyticus]|uniref:Uncharacterized protein n=1 Tax=Paenibacillus chitinolyticus TaxID=79263 RepID=A0ABT4FMP6_9BACL|nr:hypothetical protein [Paenibacillus chitinolyticus]MCY9592325.1 hypothetical protein [Paenibacillus chitinolyticus]MCY9599787.1 hypothetical protein [Paenibacillus chitinolyticus]